MIIKESLAREARNTVPMMPLTDAICHFFLKALTTPCTVSFWMFIVVVPEQPQSESKFSYL